MRPRNLIIVLCLLAAGGAAAYYYRPAAPVDPQHPVAATGARDGEAEPPVPVVAGMVEAADVPIYLTGIGTVYRLNTVSVKTRVDGQIQKVLFKEGQDVKAGDVLAQIDPRPLQAALQQMEAMKQKDQAQLISVKADLGRYEELSTKQYATKQSVDQQRAAVAQLEASLVSDQAQIDAARVQLEYTTLTSPIDGRAGIRQIDAGNIVHAIDTVPLVTVTQLQPISVVFTLPADVLPQITKDGVAAELPVTALSKDGRTVLDQGTLTLIDNQIDQTTGTIKLKATFANKRHTLWPGQFVNARLLATTRKNGLLIAATVVQRGPNGSFAYVIKPDETVEIRPIDIGPITGGRALVVGGLKLGERVVVDGQYKLRAGSKVQATAAAAGDAIIEPPSSPPDAGGGRRNPA